MSVTETVEFQDSSPCKRYRFVVTGHGKYEKVSIDRCEDTNGQSGKSRSVCAKMDKQFSQTPAFGCDSIEATLNQIPRYHNKKIDMIKCSFVL